MAPKRNMKKRISAKQKREIISRLMQISFKIDDCIYNGVQIASIEAHSLKQEIHTFKDSCRDDERSMQVIDKLTLLLQKIIEEQTTSNKNDKSCSENICISNNNNILPPININTKSLKLTETAQRATNIDDKVIINKRNITDTNQSEMLLNNKQETCVFTQDSNITQEISEDNEIVTKESDLNNQILETVMKNISLNENNKCSSEITNDEKINKKPSPVRVTSEYNTRSVSTDKKPKNNIKKSKPALTKLTKHKIATQVEKNEHINKTPQEMPTLNIVSPKLSQSSKTLQKTEIDISWVENIKYVRQTNPEEFDPKLKDVSETFWQNCVFPRDWEDSDFLMD